MASLTWLIAVALVMVSCARHADVQATETSEGDASPPFKSLVRLTQEPKDDAETRTYYGDKHRIRP